MSNKLKLKDISIQTGPGIFHAIKWGSELPENLFEELTEVASNNESHKARLCLHPNPEEKMQVTYLAFKAPYADRVHRHPHRPEVLIPLSGIAVHSTFNDRGEIIASQTMDGSKPKTFSSALGAWHSLEVVSESFVMIEIGSGPFKQDSTTYKN
jgi:cupin fold WbuC family metalloprotein